MRFTILHTNDIHSRFENFAKVSTKINELRDENTLVLDAGDFNDFMRLELQGTMGRAGSELLSIAGYDAIAMGNNEGFAGRSAAEVLATSSTIPFLSCNLYKFNNTVNKINEKPLITLRGVKRSIILEKSGVKFLIIGTSPYGEINQFYNLNGMHATNAVDEIKKEIEKNKFKYDICILLSHCGMMEDKEIANLVDGIDIIINGHSHILMDEAIKINNSIIHMSGCYGEYLGKLDIEYDGRINSFEGINININVSKPNKDIIDSLKSNKEKAINKLSEPLYKINENLWHDVVEENPISNFLADALREVLKCDIGIINSGVLNGGLKKGEVSKKKLLEICPSPLNPTEIKVLGKDIKEAFKESLDPDFCMQDGNGSGFRGKYLGRLHLSGGYIDYNGRNIINFFIGDKPLEDNRWYSVATSDYLQRGTGYNSLCNNKLIKYNAEFLRDTLEEYLQKSELVKSASYERWIKIK